MQQFIEDLTGQWTGTKTLFTPWLDVKEHTSHCPLTWRPILNEAGLGLTYNWQHEGQHHQGEVLLVHDREQHGYHAAWVDTWHQHRFPMSLSGTRRDGVIDLVGSFPAPPDPDWGWRLRIFEVEANQCKIEMFVIPPEGKGSEALAVRIVAE